MANPKRLGVILPPEDWLVIHGTTRSHRLIETAACMSLVFLASGCSIFRHPKEAAAPTKPPAQVSHSPRTSSGPRVQSVICLYDQKPWLSADLAGDRDPEGIQYRVFLNSGGNKGVACEGTFHIELYQFGRDEKGAQTRELVSDWHYPSSQFQQVSANLMGLGYHIQLFWAKKSIAGNEIEIVTQFEDPEGNMTRGATKRLRVPKYSS